ncbi:type IV secretion system protein VirB6 [Palleronia aestuarii]|uniref:Type IV secretion system protein VirB6 n=1 Tax=Palleronia aestuarii TaxID=568105 RepID=A0A2W7N209_9RHOB|nr:type IV secretion system protein [Palleronia aestuarii]PZX14178.1 type IV secretion system protein VirB6 [Palleronia aestuarii]
MASYVENTLNQVDNAIGNYAESSFTAFAGPIATICQAMGLVGLAFIALNALTQWVPIRTSEYFKWGVRYIIITAVATTWAQFEPIYDIVTNTPQELGAKLMGIVDAPNLNTAFDEIISTMFNFSDTLSENASLPFGISFAAIVVWIIGSLMAAAAIIVISLGKIGLGMAIALAPIFIPALMFKATSNLFESWVRFTLGFALIPLVMAGVVGAIVGIGQSLIAEADAAITLEDAGGFIIVGVGAIFMTAMVPTLVNGLSGTITATANGVAMAIGGATAAVGASAVAGKIATAGGREIARIGGAQIEGHRAGVAAEKSGSNYWEGKQIEFARQKEIRNKYADLNASHAAMRGGQASSVDRYRAANAGQRYENRRSRRNRRTDETKED